MKDLKRIFIALLLLMMIPALVACGSAKPQIATLTVESNPGTGYSWYAFQSEDLFEITSEYVEPKENLLGAAGTEVFTLTPLKAGEGKVSFVYQREGEAMELGDTYTYKITVSKNLQVKVTGCEANVAGTAEVLPTIPDLVVSEK